MNASISFAVGLIFGLGLILSGMFDPAKVLGFLDLAGLWDPSLALVMAGAIPVAFVAFRIAAGRATTLLGLPVDLPKATRIDRPLILGSAIFGIGWGLAGICPGPSFVLLGIDPLRGLVFILALLAGMGLFELYRRIQKGVLPAE
jgi:uncharacterized membrane protein YedE/YeeE